MVCGHADCTWLIIDDRLSLCATEKTDKGTNVSQNLKNASFSFSSILLQ